MGGNAICRSLGWVIVLFSPHGARLLASAIFLIFLSLVGKIELRNVHQIGDRAEIKNIGLLLAYHIGIIWTRCLSKAFVP